MFKSGLRQLQRGKALEPLVFFDDGYLLALEGTGYFSSKTMHCASGRHKVHRTGSGTSQQQMFGAALVPPDMRAVIPLMPEPIVQQEGTDKNAGERTAATRFIAKLRRDHPHRTCLITAESLRANAPHSATRHDHGLHDILGVKEGDHALLVQQVQVAEHAGRVTSSERHDRAARVVQRCRCVNDVPLKASNPDVRVHGIEYWERNDDKVHHCSWVTDCRVNTRNVLHLRRGGRARWKSANETLNTLKNPDDHFEHPYGQGEQHLSVVCAMLMRRAFVVDQAQQLWCALFQAVWAQLGRKRMRWERRRAVFDDEALTSRRQLFEALLDGFKKFSPIVAMDSSSSPSIASATACQRTSPAGDLPAGGERGLHHEKSLLATRRPPMSNRESLFPRRKWMVDTLTKLSASIVAEDS